MRISDWSSDVCSSDLDIALRDRSVFFTQDKQFTNSGVDQGHALAQAFAHRTFDAGVPHHYRALAEVGRHDFRVATQEVAELRQRRGLLIGVHGGHDLVKSTRGDRGDEVILVLRVIVDRGFADPQSRSEEHTSELQSLMRISYAVFC